MTKTDNNLKDALKAIEEMPSIKRQPPTLAERVARLERIEAAVYALAVETDDFENAMDERATPEMWQELADALNN